MKWEPIPRGALDALVAKELADCPVPVCEFFTRWRVSPMKWVLRPWGDQGGGFWVVAVFQDQSSGTMTSRTASMCRPSRSAVRSPLTSTGAIKMS
jgi:hypothetical protein